MQLQPRRQIARKGLPGNESTRVFWFRKHFCFPNYMGHFNGPIRLATCDLRLATCGEHGHFWNECPNPQKTQSGKPTSGKKGDDFGICFNFRDKGECRFGENCRFRHEKQDKKPGAQTPAAKGNKNKARLAQALQALTALAGEQPDEGEQEKGVSPEGNQEAPP